MTLTLSSHCQQSNFFHLILRNNFSIAYVTITDCARSLQSRSQGSSYCSREREVTFLSEWARGRLYIVILIVCSDSFFIIQLHSVQLNMHILQFGNFQLAPCIRLQLLEDENSSRQRKMILFLLECPVIHVSYTWTCKLGNENVLEARKRSIENIIWLGFQNTVITLSVLVKRYMNQAEISPA